MAALDIELAPIPRAFIAAVTLRNAPAAHAGVPSLNCSISLDIWPCTVEAALTSPLTALAASCCVNVAVAALAVDASLRASSVFAATITSSLLSILFTSTTSSAPTAVSSAVTSGSNSDFFSSAVANSSN